MDKTNNSIKRFPIFPVGKILNPFIGNLKQKVEQKYKEISILYPCRLDAMAINPAAVAYNEKLAFTPGEITLSINNFIQTTVRIISPEEGIITISERTRRKALVKHTYYLITELLNINPSVYIDVEDSNIPKHCGFGSSSSTITSVAVSLNELYGKPIRNEDLIRYLASNHGEEVKDSENKLKSVQSIGGGACSGLLPYGLIVIAGHATPIASVKIPKTKIVVGIPKDFEQQPADFLMKLEENNLWKFVRTGKKYKDAIAYRLLHQGIPNMLNKDISSLSDVVFDYRFNMGSIRNCSFVYPKMVKLAKSLRELYEKKHCKMLSLSSVGPAFFAVVSSKKELEICQNKMEHLGMYTRVFSLNNSTYKVIERKK